MSTSDKQVKRMLREFIVSEIGDFSNPIRRPGPAGPIRATDDVPRPRIVCIIPRDSGAITDSQAYTLQVSVKAVVRVHAVPYQTLWSSLNTRMKVPSYRMIPAEHFERALGFLAHWHSTGLPPL